MKVKINGKIFKAHEKEENQFEITKGIDMFDLMFFKDWVNAQLILPYKEDIPYISKLGYGKMKNCSPYELTENSITFVYDKIESAI